MTHSSSSSRPMEFWGSLTVVALTYERVFTSGIIHNHGAPHGLVKHRPSPTTSLQGFDVDDTVEYYASTIWALENGWLAALRLRHKREIVDRNSAATCTAEVPQLEPLNWRVASGHTKVCGGLDQPEQPYRFCWRGQGGQRHPLKEGALLYDLYKII